MLDIARGEGCETGCRSRKARSLHGDVRPRKVRGIEQVTHKIIRVMKQIVNRLRMTLTLMLLISFWGLCVSLAPSSDDGSAKSFPSLHRRTMDPQKDFHTSIVGRWIRQKFSTPLSSDDGPEKRFPHLYRRTMDNLEPLHGAMQYGSLSPALQPLPSPPLKGRERDSQRSKVKGHSS